MEDCGPCCHCFPKQSKDIILEVNGVKAQREITRTAEVNQIEVDTSSASWDQMDLQLHPLKQRPTVFCQLILKLFRLAQASRDHIVDELRKFQKHVIVWDLVTR